MSMTCVNSKLWLLNFYQNLFNACLREFVPDDDKPVFMELGLLLIRCSWFTKCVPMAYLIKIN